MVIFLRGRGGSHEDFVDEGFVDVVRERRLPVDMAAPDAHFGYYMGETLIPQPMTVAGQCQECLDR